MIFGIDLDQIFVFPFKDAAARRHFLTGCLVALAGFVIPLLPFLLIYGYAVRIAKQVLKGEEPHMVEWDDCEGMFKDGAKIFGIRMVYSLPILILIIPLFMALFTMPILAGTLSNSNLDLFFPFLMAVIFGVMCLVIPISIPLSIIIPAAEMHVVDQDEFAAGFRIREWWTVLRSNLVGFIAAFAIYYVSSMLLTIALQIISATLIFACLLFFLVPAITPYILLIKYAVMAQAYRTGRERSAQSETAKAAETL